MSQHQTCPHCQTLNSPHANLCENCGRGFWVAPGQADRKGSQAWLKVAGLAGLVWLMGVGAGMTLHGKQPVPPATPDGVTAPPVVVSGERPQLDVVFAIDTTGSMADEIEVVKSQVVSMMNKVQAGQPRPYVRVGLVAFRDRGDEYITRTFALTDDLTGIQNSVNELVADGGGDTPESVNQALHVAVHDMNWDANQKTRKLLFLIGDAGPHLDYAGDYDYRRELSDARQQGIKVHVWGCSGIEDQGQSDFVEIARLGGGDFAFLTYRQEVVKQDGSRGYVLFQGHEAYEQKDEAADWKVGADCMEKSQVEALPSSGFGAPGAAGAPSVAPSYGTVSRNARMENNLDKVMTDQVQKECEAAGARY